jgi:hypothetical protein
MVFSLSRWITIHNMTKISLLHLETEERRASFMKAISFILRSSSELSRRSEFGTDGGSRIAGDAEEKEEVSEERDSSKDWGDNSTGKGSSIPVIALYRLKQCNFLCGNHESKIHSNDNIVDRKKGLESSNKDLKVMWYAPRQLKGDIEFEISKRTLLPVPGYAVPLKWLHCGRVGWRKRRILVNARLAKSADCCMS